MTTPDVTGDLWAPAQAHGVAMLAAAFAKDYDTAEAIARKVADEDGEAGTFALAVVLIAGSTGGVHLVGIGRAPVDDLAEMTMVDIDETPPFVRAVARLPGYITHNDVDTAWAIWRTMPTEDQHRALAAFLHIAVISLDD